MNNELKVEHYLLQLDRELSALTVSQRAEIITEIKSHIRETQEMDPQKDVDTILRDLGPARAVAEKYLQAKGVTSTAVKRTTGGSWFKWFAIGTVALMASIFIAGMAVIYYLSPLIKIDKQGGRVTLLGGLIDVNENLGQVRVGSLTMNDAMNEKGPGVESEGETDLAGAHVKLLRIPFNTAKLEVQAGKSQLLTWKCESATNSATPKVEINAGVATLNLDALNLARCLISLPFGTQTEIRGVNGHMDVEKPSSGLDIQLANGKINVKADPEQTYDFDVNVKNGLQDIFPRSGSPAAVKVKINVTNGMVKKQ